MGRLESSGPSTSSRRSGGVRAPSWSHPGPTRPAKNGTIAPAWWVRIFRSGWRSNTPEKTTRDMNAEVSYGHPEDPPDLEARLLLGDVVGERGAAARVHPDRPDELGHLG